jgi:hypothetical protein
LAFAQLPTQSSLSSSNLLCLPNHHSQPVSSRSSIVSCVSFQEDGMKLSSLVGSAATLLLAGFSSAKAVPVDAIVPRDFSADLRNFHQIQQLLHNLRSRIGVPFSAMRNVGLPFHQTLEVKPLDLVLLPSGYCFSCSTPPHTEPDQSKPPNPFHNEMVELDESQLLVACTDNTSDAKPDEWPLMKACPGQEKVLRDFLFDVCGHGSRLAIPKARLEKAPVFQIDKRTCIPMNSKQTACSTTPSSTTASFTISPLTLKSGNKSGDPLQDLLSSIYQPKSLPATTTSLVTASAKTLASTKTPSASAASTPTSTKPEATSTSSSAFPSPPKPTKLPTLTLTKRRILAPSNDGPPDPVAYAAYASAASVAGLQREKDYWNAMHSAKASEASARRAAAASESAFSASRERRHAAASASYHSCIQMIQHYRLPLNTVFCESVSSASTAAPSSSKEHKLAARAQEPVQAPSSTITVSFLSTTTEHEVIVSTGGYPNGATVVPRPSKLTKSLVARASAVEATQAAVSTSGSSGISASIAALTSTEADQLLLSTPVRQESGLEESSAVCTSILSTTAADKVIEDRHRGHHHHYTLRFGRPCSNRPTYPTRDPLWRDPDHTPTRATPPTTRTTTVEMTAGPQLLSSINSIYRQWGVPTVREFKYAEVEKKTFGIP